MHLAQDPVDEACRVKRKVVDSYYACVETGDVVLHGVGRRDSRKAWCAPHVNHQEAKLVRGLGVPPYVGVVDADRLRRLWVPRLAVHRPHVGGLHQPHVGDRGDIIGNAREVCGGRGAVVLSQFLNKLHHLLPVGLRADEDPHYGGLILLALCGRVT